MEVTDYKAATEEEGLLTWAKAMEHYMEIAIKIQGEKLATIAIDIKDLEIMRKIVGILENRKLLEEMLKETEILGMEVKENDGTSGIKPGL